jgi:16S rRNA (cytosine1402-N4)-methyltransferase
MNETTNFHHISVLSQELISGLEVMTDGHYLDVTVGGGGHSKLILQSGDNIKVTALDRDINAIIAAKENLQEYGDRLQFIHSNYAEYNPQIEFDGIIADLGVSSAQLDIAERGFSFRNSADLDMRMDQGQNLTAADIINDWDERELADIFFKYGEERLSRKIARRIVEKRPFYTTTELAEAIAYSVPPAYRYGRIHPATRVFQALRIVVNEELTSLEKFLQKAPNWLKIGGKIGVISFHSLEDRIVKHTLKGTEILKVLTKKPILPQEEEMKNNARSRSAKLRFAERVK